MDSETKRNIKRLERELWKLFEEDRLLRERIAALGGTSMGAFFSATESEGGTLVAGDGISGGGTFPGTVQIDVDLYDAWSGLEFETAELRVDVDEDFDWLGVHTFAEIATFYKGLRGELLAAHTAMGEAHGLGGQVAIAPVGALRSTISYS